MNQRRGKFLALCLCVYVFCMAAWWLSSRSPRQFPPVKLYVGAFAGAKTDFLSQLEESLKNAPNVQLTPGGAILNGSVEGSDDVKVTVQLIDAATGEPFWSKEYKASPAEPRPISQEVARDAVAEARKRLR